jgi:formate-dependent nitrite reductase membrane component NrfD
MIDGSGRSGAKTGLVKVSPVTEAAAWVSAGVPALALAEGVPAASAAATAAAATVTTPARRRA